MAKEKNSVKDSKMICKSCNSEFSSKELKRNLKVCPKCNRHFHMNARERIEAIADKNSFKEWFPDMISVDPLHFVDRLPYKDRLDEAALKTGLKEAVVVGKCSIGGNSAVLCVLDFEFMGGTMGSVVGEKISRAFLRAVEQKLPVVSIVSSGGARMQEGMLSLMQMAKTASAVALHHKAKLLYISIQTNPTTGGISASFSSLGDVILAEPKALIGFVGPRVIEQTLNIKLPPESHTAEFLRDRGMIDLIVHRRNIKITLSKLIKHFSLAQSLRLKTRYKIPKRKNVEADAWEIVQLARNPLRPTPAFYIEKIFDNFVELHGDRYFGDDSAVIGGVGELGGNAVVIVALEKGITPEDKTKRRDGMAGPEGYRKAVRMMKLAEKFSLPLITFVDTPGAFPGFDSEMRGIARSLAESLFTMSTLSVPVISIVTGEGGSGGALALALANRVLMQENAIYSVISPEGASAILWGDATKARELAPYLKLTSTELKELGVIDEIVYEPEQGAHTGPEESALILKERLLTNLEHLRKFAPAKLVSQRIEKFQDMGKTGIFWQEIVKKELQLGMEKLVKGITNIWHKDGITNIEMLDANLKIESEGK